MNLHTHRTLAVAALAIACACPVVALADGLHVEAGAGLSAYSAGPDGIWYQAGNPHTLALRSSAFRVGLTGTAAPWLDWRADAVSLGTAASRCSCTPRDDYYDTQTHTQRPGAPVPNAQYVGSGRVFGLELAALPHVTTRAGLQLGAVAGVFVGRASWREDAYGWEYDPALGAAWGGHPATNRLQMARTLVRPVVGLYAARGPWSLSIERFGLRAGGQVPPLYTAATVVTLNYQF